MSYIALYRKLRPLNFNDMIGQEHIVRTLINQINTGKISHAYLFCGTRGTGKTTTAKIFARAVNCDQPKDGEPCTANTSEICESCEAILSQSTMDILEIDAASNNGVDNIREIRDEVKYPPAKAKYKVYIIDEVHMLSTGAFNALLKTLEEPPGHVIFILATTEPQKVPVTIHSRCQRFDFKRISTKDMTSALKSYMQKENVEIDDDAIGYAARISEGAMRDAINTLDQCAGFYYGEKITLNKLRDLIGAVDENILFEFAENLYNHDSAKIINMINEIVLNGKDIKHFSDEMTTHFRNLLISITLPGDSLALDLPEESIKMLRKQSGGMDRETLIHYVTEFSALQNKMRYASNDRLILEVECLKLCNPYIYDNENFNSRLKRLEEVFDGNMQMNLNYSDAAVTVEANESKPAVKLEPAVKQKPVIKQNLEDTKSDEDIKPFIKKWDEFTNCFSNPLKAFLTMTDPLHIKNGTLHISCDDSNLKLLEARSDLIEEKITGFFMRSLKVKFIRK